MEKSFGCLYTAFDESGRRNDYHSKDVSKLEIVKLYQDLYSEYLKIYSELRDIKKEKEELEIKYIEVEAKVDAPIKSLFDSPNFTTRLEGFIDEIIKKKLSFDEESEMYSGLYASLNYENQQLGDSICLSRYSDD